jgi:hypothetical protein
MRRTTTAFAPRVEGLETLQLLSTLAARPSIGTPQVIVRPYAVAPLKLTGTVRGLYVIQFASDTQSTFRLQGSGSVTGLGPARLSGDLASSQPQDTMDVTLTGRRGSVTLRLAASTGALSSSASAGRGQRVSYALVAATGIYEGASTQGTADLIIQPAMRSMGLAGRMTLVLRP